MNSGLLFYLSETEYQEKRFETSKTILASAITSEQLGQITEEKKREAMIFNCILLADSLLEELGYVCGNNPVEGSNPSSSPEPTSKQTETSKLDPTDVPNLTKIRSLKSILESGED